MAREGPSCLSDPDSPNLAKSLNLFKSVGEIGGHTKLGAALSLSRLWQWQGMYAAAQALLAPIYGWFTEGFDTADLQAAQALLHTLAAAACPDCAAPC